MKKILLLFITVTMYSLSLSAQVVTCGAPLNSTYCYANDANDTWSYSSSDGSTLTVTFTAGQIETCCDNLTIYDGTDASAPVLYSYNYVGDIAGVTVTSTGTNLFMTFTSDGSVACTTNGYIAWDWDVSCGAAPPSCGAGPQTDETHCYDNDANDSWSYISGDGTSPVTITFNAGQMENCCDNLYIYDGIDATAPLLYSGVNVTDLTGVTVTSTGANIFMNLTSDGSVACTTSGYTPWDWTVCGVPYCGPALNDTYCYDNFANDSWAYTSYNGSSSPTITFNAGQIEACCDDLTIYDGIDATAPVLYSYANSGDITGVTATATGLDLFMTFTSDGSVACTSNGYTPWDWDVTCGIVPPPAGIVNCGTPLNDTYCYDNNANDNWSYISGDGVSPVTITFNAGTIEGCCDDLTIYDGTDASAPVLYSYNDVGDIAGVTVTSTGTNLFMTFTSDASGSCVSGGYTSWDWDVECTVPVVTCGTPLNSTYCYDNNANDNWSYSTTDPARTLTLTFNAGQIETCCDYLTIYDGTDASAPVLYSYNNVGEYAEVLEL